MTKPQGRKWDTNLNKFDIPGSLVVCDEHALGIDLMEMSHYEFSFHYNFNIHTICCS